MLRPLVLLGYSVAAALAADSSGANSLGQLALQKILQDSQEIFGVESGDPSHAYANWMARVPDNTPLAHLNIPGTHDAATWNYTQATQDALAYATRCDGGAGPSPAEVYRTQRHGAAAALDGGVRFFDLRFALDPLNGDLVFWHGAALLSARSTVDDVLFAFYAWLEAHRSETVLLSFQYEAGTKVNATFDRAARDRLRGALGSEAAGRYIRRDAGRLGTLGESRGKIVLLRRFDMGGAEDDELPGLHLGPSKWPDNDPDGFEIVYNTTTGETAYIEDYYEPTLPANSSVAENIQAKMDAVRTHLKKAATAAAAAGNGADSLFITFASGEHDTNVPHVFPQTMALGNGSDVTPDGGVNHQLVASLQDLRGSRLGVVVLDFFEEPADLVGLVLGF
ncbi:PLC-like phosphodiesterase [Daldinia sp. FL1419]|nr:PLC-like phosphodiesterase [Daldinia sp. FL1419]